MEDGPAPSAVPLHAGVRIDVYPVDIPGANKWYNKGKSTALYVTLFVRKYTILKLLCSKLFGNWYSKQFGPRLQAHQLTYVWEQQSPLCIQVRNLALLMSIETYMLPSTGNN
jgi:hypothetical protein